MKLCLRPQKLELVSDSVIRLIRGLPRILTPDFFLARDWFGFGKMMAEVVRLHLL